MKSRAGNSHRLRHPLVSIAATYAAILGLGIGYGVTTPRLAEASAQQQFLRPTANGTYTEWG